MRLIYHPAAEGELIQAARFYEGRLPGLGSEFIVAVERALEILGRAPERCRIIDKDVRRYLMPRFPFAIYYRVINDELRVLALKHHKRHPDYWRGRLADESD